jgi:hypothetical protein
MRNPGNTYDKLQRKLHTLRQKEKANMLLTGGVRTVCFFLSAVLVLAVLEAMFRFSSSVRGALLVAFFVGLMSVLIGWIGKPFFSLLFRRSEPDDDRLALHVGNTYSAIKDRLTDALQVFRFRGKNPYNTSSELAEASLEDIYGEVDALDFNRVVSKKNLRRAARILILVLGITVIGVGAFPRTLGNAIVRIGQPHKSFRIPVPYRLTLHPGNTRIIQGEDVEITLDVEGAPPAEIRLTIQPPDEDAREYVLERPFRYRISSMRNSITYFAHTEELRTPTYRIDVVQRPIIRTLHVKQIPPAYTRQSSVLQEPNAGEVEAITGTRVEVSLTANKTLNAASLQFENGGRRKMTIQDQEAAGTFVVTENDRYWVGLTDTLGLTNSDPISYAIRALPDLHPVARILFPAKNIDLDESMILPLTLEGEDDYGLSLLRLGYRIHRGGIIDSSDADLSYLSIPSDDEIPRKILLDYEWTLQELELLPEDVVSYFFEVFDNDRISGPKSSRSRTYTARFPSIYEIFHEVETEQAGQEVSLQEIYDESQILQEELQRIADDIKAGKQLEWEERKRLEDMAEDQQQMANQVEDLRERLDDLVDRLERNDLLSMETLAKYQELQQLYQDVASPELLEAMKKLQESIDQLGQEALKNAMEQFQFSQESFLKSIERTMSLLKRLQVEQKTDELVKRIDDLVQRQEAVNQTLESDEESRLPKLAQNESAIQEDTEALRQEMEKLHGMMESLTGMPTDDLEQTMEMMDNQDLLGQLTRAQQAMDAGNRNQAEQEGAGAQQTMATMAEMLKEMQKNLQNEQKNRVADALKRNSFRLLQLSKGQEDLMQASQGGKVKGSQAAQQQNGLLQGISQVADSLVQLSQQTFFVTPEIGKALGQAQSQMQQALQLMEQSGGQGSDKHQGRAMGAVNQAVLAIQNAMNQMAGSSSGLGMEQFMQQMQQMAMQQMGINQQTLELSQKGRLSMAEQAAMARLASEQAAIQKALEELLREFGNRSEIMGRLDRMAEDMEKVVRDLKQQRASPETIRRQERILSRLLDAQHSIRRRDYSRKRQAQTGRDTIRQSPGAIPVTMPDWRDRLRQDILRLSNEGYTKDYQELIRKYFEALAREDK